MKRSAFLLTALGLTSLGLLAPDQPARAAPQPATYVVVDPTDLRKPVPDPEQGLTQKYDGQVVRFTGQLQRVTLNRKSKKYSYEMHYVIVHRLRVKGKAPRVTKETIVVPVTFLKDEKQLRARNRGFTLTVQGKGSIMVDGTLVISDAVIVPDKPLIQKK
jgi:hypothetical protein